MTDADTKPVWEKAASLDSLNEAGKLVVKLSGKQILLIKSGDAVYAINNRCPHEGFPLSEGTLSGDGDEADDCILTCNWHSWRFNLEDGEAIVGGDAVRTYPYEIRDGDLWLDIADPAPELMREKALDGLKQAFDEHDYERIARELARFEQAKGNPLTALTQTFTWAMDGLEFGTTHAHAAAPDWLALRASIADGNAIEKRIPVVEIIGHLSWDCLMQKGPFAFADTIAEKFDATIFEQAIEDEREADAIAQARAGLREGGSKVLHAPLQRASLAHYQAFGHSVIYLDKTFELIGLLGKPAEEALILPLVRALCSTAREDLIPEFKAYAPALARWNGTGDAEPVAEKFRDQGVAAALELTANSSARQDALYDALMYAAFDAMLHYDARYRQYTDKPVQQNIDWLDFTHAITHLNAARKVCADQPALWANALLQTGCFLGRNAKFVDWEQDVSGWNIATAEPFISGVLNGMLDHGEPLYIYPVHSLKLATALREELVLNSNASWKPVALAALNRFVNEPVKRKHMRRVVTQASKFVELEG